MSWILNNFYYYLGYENEIKPTPETLKQRNLVLKQVLLSSKGMREKQNKINIIIENKEQQTLLIDTTNYKKKKLKKKYIIAVTK